MAPLVAVASIPDKMYVRSTHVPRPTGNIGDLTLILAKATVSRHARSVHIAKPKMHAPDNVAPPRDTVKVGVTYEERRTSVALAAGFPGRARIGKGIVQFAWRGAVIRLTS